MPSVVKVPAHGRNGPGRGQSGLDSESSREWAWFEPIRTRGMMSGSAVSGQWREVIAMNPNGGTCVWSPAHSQGFLSNERIDANGGNVAAYGSAQARGWGRPLMMTGTLSSLLWVAPGLAQQPDVLARRKCQHDGNDSDSKHVTLFTSPRQKQSQTSFGMQSPRRRRLWLQKTDCLRTTCGIPPPPAEISPIRCSGMNTAAAAWLTVDGIRPASFDRERGSCGRASFRRQCLHRGGSPRGLRVCG